MTVEFLQRGEAVDHTPAADVTAGDVIVQGDLVGVAKKDIKANELGALATEGVFEFPKDTSTAIAAGVDVYWDAIAKEATEDPAGGANKHAGKTILAAASADTHVSVKLPGAGGTTGETGGLQTVRQSVALADFTDNGDATGYVDLTEQVPAGSLVLGVELDVRQLAENKIPSNRSWVLQNPGLPETPDVRRQRSEKRRIQLISDL